ncbi:hypothetical protein CPLU01_05372 [Colletotrichum plurivorum]|uniref:Uncharacterized protein n=1 Tax=Colletotrichum plurivorum TaxID=2175906 RepID=A0A8H6KMU6_9PEZI|nr:hypothetical protein CPLU01_05372 [Colletotrichum plurivorum]
MEFCFYLSPDGTPEAKLAAQVSERFTNPMWTAGRRMERFRMLRLALQLSSRTRAMVHRKFRRLLAWNPAIQDNTPIWVYSEIDRFNPILCRMPEDCLSLSKALLHPTSVDDALVQCIESVQGLPREFLNEEYNVDMDTLLSLPRLREVTLDSAMLRICSNRLELPDDDHPHPSDDIITVPNNLFPSLGRWIQWKTEGIESFCRRARERDIRVFVGAGGNSEIRKLELVLTADGVRCKLISPICTCDL